MGWTAPFTAVAGTAWKAADWNTYGRDNLAWLATDSPACRAYNSAAISHTTTGAWQALTFNSERFDNASMHSTASNTSRFTIPTGGGGKYLCGAVFEFGSNATGFREAGIEVNGTSFVAVSATVSVGAGAGTAMTITTATSLAAADYVEVMAWQNSGGALNVTNNANYSPEGWVMWFRT